MQVLQPLRAAIYTRVSSDEQTKGYGLKYQTEDCKQAVTNDGNRLVMEYSDPGVSGTLEDRPGLNALRSDAKLRRFDILYVWKSDRLARDEILQLTLYRELKALGIEVRSVTEPQMNDLMRGIYAVFGAEDLRNLKAKMYSGRLRAMRDGKWMGAPPYGYMKDSRTFRLKPNPKEAPWVEQLFRWFVEDRLTVTRLAQRIHAHRVPSRWDARKKSKPRNGPGFWSKGSLVRLLRRECYATGVATVLKSYAPRRSKPRSRPQNEWISISVPPLISPDLFARAQRQLDTNRQNSPRRMRRPYLFAKKLVCGHCGRRLTGACRPEREADKYYRSSAWTETRCANCRHYLERDLDEPIWARLLTVLRDPHHFIAPLDAYRLRGTRHHDIHGELKTLDACETKLLRMEQGLLHYELEGFYSSATLSAKKAQLRAQRQELNERRQALNKLLLAERRRATTAASAAQLYQQLRSRLECPSYETKRKIFSVLLDKVVLYGRRAEVWLSIPIDGASPAVIRSLGGEDSSRNEQTRHDDSPHAHLRSTPQLTRITNSGGRDMSSDADMECDADDNNSSPVVFDVQLRPTRTHSRLLSDTTAAT